MNSWARKLSPLQRACNRNALPETALIAGERGGRTKICGAATKRSNALARRRSAGSKPQFSFARSFRNIRGAKRPPLF